MWQDVRYAIRTLIKNPGFTCVAVIAIALAVGPNSAVFTMVHSVLLRPLPYPDPDRLVMLWEKMPERGLDMVPVSGPTYTEWKRRSHSFEDMSAAFTIPEYGFNVTFAGEPVRAQAAKSSANFFQVMGIKAELGRLFQPEDDRPGSNPAVLVSNSFWRSRFGSDPTVVGRTIGLDGVLHTVVGILPEAGGGLTKVDLWIPMRSDLALESHNNHMYGIMARLKPGVSVVQAQSEIDGIHAQLRQQYPAEYAGTGATVFPLLEIASGRIRPALIILLGAVGVLLLIACANVAGLQLARASTRTRELSLRLAVGAHRWQLIRLVLIESVIVALAGGVLGLLLAFWCVGGLRGMIPDILLRLKEMTVDGRVLAFTVLVSVFTGVLFGLAPALRAARTDLNDTLREGARGTIEGGTQRLRSVLLVGEVSLSLVLLVGAGLMIRSFMKVTAVDPGFQRENLLTMHVTLPDAKYGDSTRRVNFSRSVVQRLEALPGVHSAAIVDYLPMRGNFLNMRINVQGFHVIGQPEAPAGKDPTADVRVITAGYLNTMAIQLRQGRAFTAQDTDSAQPVILVNEALAQRYFPGGSALGQRIEVYRGDARQVVGVVADVKLQRLDARAEPAIYLPFEQRPAHAFSLVLRTGTDPATLSSAVRREIFSIDPDQPVSDMRSMAEVVDESLVLRRLSMWMLGAFAVLALTLATVGVYGMTSYAVSRRTHEIGLRMALGAQPLRILRMVLGRGFVVTLIGILLGLPGAFALARLMQGLLFGVSAKDPLVFAGVAVLLTVVAVVACYIPARRAIRIDPIEALRHD